MLESFRFGELLPVARLLTQFSTMPLKTLHRVAPCPSWLKVLSSFVRRYEQPLTDDLVILQ